MESPAWSGPYGARYPMLHIARCSALASPMLHTRSALSSNSGPIINHQPPLSFAFPAWKPARSGQEGGHQTTLAQSDRFGRNMALTGCCAAALAPWPLCKCWSPPLTALLHAGMVQPSRLRSCYRSVQTDWSIRVYREMQQCNIKPCS